MNDHIPNTGNTHRSMTINDPVEWEDGSTWVGFTWRHEGTQTLGNLVAAKSSQQHKHC